MSSKIFGLPPYPLKYIEAFHDRYMPEPNSGCWLWTGSVTHQGYGLFHIRNKRQAAHRVSYRIHKGEIPSGLLVCHKCDMPLCVNPDHLFAGTYKDNTRDCIDKGRIHRWAGSRSGEYNPSAKLTLDEVELIKKILEAKVATQGEIAKAFHVSRSNIAMIATGAIWENSTHG